MIKKRGIAFKTFMFTSGLIILIVLISFGILYFTLPPYYLYSKNKTLGENSNSLVEALQSTESPEQCAQLITTFVKENNTSILAYDNNDELIPDYSSFFLLANEELDNQVVTITINEESEEDIHLRKVLRMEEANEMDEVDETDATDEFSSYYYSTSITDESNPFYIELNNVSFVPYYEEYTEDAIGIAMDASIKNSLIDHLVISSTLQPIDEAKGVILSLMPFVLILDILLATLAAYFYTRWLTRPILHISDATERMQEMTPDALSNIRTADELGTLSENLDSLYLTLCANIERLTYEIDKANKLEQSKTDFMRAASHELKTPITALNGIVEGMIDNVGVFKDKDKYLLESKLLIQRLSQLVGEILQVSRLDTPEQSVVHTAVRVEVLFGQALSLYQLPLNNKHLSFQFTPFELEIETDPQVLFTILSNLISNAVKYTPEKGFIHVYCIDDRFIIENQCAYIPEKKLSRLFEPFYTLDYSRDKNKSGTGLGLYIVQKNLEALGYDYHLSSEEDVLRFMIKFQ